MRAFNYRVFASSSCLSCSGRLHLNGRNYPSRWPDFPEPRGNFGHWRKILKYFYTLCFITYHSKFLSTTKLYVPNQHASTNSYMPAQIIEYKANILKGPEFPRSPLQLRSSELRSNWTTRLLVDITHDKDLHYQDVASSFRSKVSSTSGFRHIELRMSIDIAQCWRCHI